MYIYLCVRLCACCMCLLRVWCESFMYSVHICMRESGIYIYYFTLYMLCIYTHMCVVFTSIYFLFISHLLCTSLKPTFFMWTWKDSWVVCVCVYIVSILMYVYVYVYLYPPCPSSRYFSLFYSYSLYSPLLFFLVSDVHRDSLPYINSTYSRHTHTSHHIIIYILSVCVCVIVGTWLCMFVFSV